MIELRALFSDETADYKTPYFCKAGDNITLRIRTAKNNADSVYAVINGRRKKMRLSYSKARFDYYEYSYTCSLKTDRYYFEVINGDERVCYNRIGAVENAQEQHSFAVMPGFYVPEWALGTVYYQIFVDRFRNGDKTNDVCDNEYFYNGDGVKHVDDWYSAPQTDDVGRFYGGDLQGVMQKLDYLKDLGVETIYFNPIFISPSNHKYDIQDYAHIDPHFAVISDDEAHPLPDGIRDNSKARQYIRRTVSEKNLADSDACFAKLCQEVHKRGMRLVLDGVFNHCGSFNRWLDREGIYSDDDGAFLCPNSDYSNFFKFYDREHREYESWWRHHTLPKLNFEGSEELETYILDIAKKWVSAPYNADGWRLDVAADLGHSEDYNHRFWRSFRRNVRSANPEAVILSEHYGSPSAWLDGKQWDTVMNYDAFMEPVTWFLTGMEKHSDYYDSSRLFDGKAFFDMMLENMSRLPRASLDAAMNELSNHDHSRFLTRTNRTVGRTNTLGAEAAEKGINENIMKLAVLMQMTWVGAPGIYYGDEAGLCGWTDPDNRRSYPWGRENKEMLAFHKSAAKLHRELSCLRRGSIKPLAMGHGYVAYGRFDAKQAAIVIVNALDKELKLDIPFWETGAEEEPRLCFTSCGFPDAKYKNGILSVSVPAETGCVFRADIE